LVSDSSRVHQIRFRPGYVPDPAGELRLPSWIKGALLVRVGRGGERDGKKGEGREVK